MVEQASISSEILASYAADAARDVDGVSGLADSHFPLHRAVRIGEADGGVTVELRLSISWGASIPEVGRTVQERVAAYLARMAGVQPVAVDVVVEEIDAP